jgi:hypothetical protein
MKPPTCLALKIRTRLVGRFAPGRAYLQETGERLTVLLPRIKEVERLKHMVAVIIERIIPNALTDDSTLATWPKSRHLEQMNPSPH